MTLPDRLSPSVLALALIAAFGPAWSQTAPAVEGSASVGIGLVSGDREDRSQYDQYNGLRPGSNAFGIFGADYYRRDDAKGTVIEFQASDLLNRNRELGLALEEARATGSSADYGETMRNETAFANTGLIGARQHNTAHCGSARRPRHRFRPRLQGSSARPGLRVLQSAVQPAAVGRQRAERKEGRLAPVGHRHQLPQPDRARLPRHHRRRSRMGGADASRADRLRTTARSKARLTYAGERLNLSGGYYGSFYRNEHGSLNPVVPGSLYNAVGGCCRCLPACSRS